MRPLFCSLAIIASVAFARPLRAAPEAVTTDDFPCAGCITRAPTDTTPRPLLVALHGDGGGVKKLFRAWTKATDEAGVVLVALRCPIDLGCRSGSFWQWLNDSRHDPEWIGKAIDRVSARYAIDPRRIYATGYSGGATYLGWYVPTHATRFAAVAHVAGGMPYGVACPACKVPVLFTLGAPDPMLTPYTRPLRDYYTACGEHEISWETLPGVTHEGILDVLAAGKAKTILAWLLARPASCAIDLEDGGIPPDASTDATAPISDLPIATAVAASPNPPPADPPAVSPSPRGCGCALAPNGEGLSSAITLTAIALAVAARRSSRITGARASSRRALSGSCRLRAATRRR